MTASLQVTVRTIAAPALVLREKPSITLQNLAHGLGVPPTPVLGPHSFGGQRTCDAVQRQVGASRLDHPGNNLLLRDMWDEPILLTLPSEGCLPREIESPALGLGLNPCLPEQTPDEHARDALANRDLLQRELFIGVKTGYFDFVIKALTERMPKAITQIDAG